MQCGGICADRLRRAFKDDGAIIYDSHDSAGNIQDQVDDALAFVKKSIRCALVITPGKADHDSVWDYPLNAVRETLANAICHRDYGAAYDVQVNVYEDSLRISSPGQLPFDMPMSLLMDPRHASRPRNKIIAQAFFDMGVIERYGGGIKRIKKDCDRNGNAYPDWIDRSGEFVTEYRPRGLPANEVGGKGHEVGGKDCEVGGKDCEVGGKGRENWSDFNFEHALSGIRKDFRETCQRVFEQLLEDETLLQHDIANRLHMADSSVRNAYAALRDAKLLIKDGEGRGSKWRINRDAI